MNCKSLRNLFVLEDFNGLIEGRRETYPLDSIHVSMLVPTDRIRKDQLTFRDFGEIKVHITEEDEWEESLLILAVRLYERYDYAFNHEALIDKLKNLKEAKFMDDDFVIVHYRKDQEFPIIIEGRNNTLFFGPYARGAEPNSIKIGEREI